MRLLQNAGKRLVDAATGGELERLGVGLRTTRKQLKEASREIERYKEDTYWTRRSQEQKTQDRATVRGNCRHAFQRGDPFIKGALRLMTEFCFEQGIDGPTSEDPNTQDAIDAFWQDPSNQQMLFGTVAQHRASNQLLVDGDYFALVRVGQGDDKRTAVRYMPAGQVVDIVTDPLDIARVLYYKCVIPRFEWDRQRGNWKQSETNNTVYYRDIFNTDPANDAAYDWLGEVAEEDALLEHISINALEPGQFGWPEPAVSMPWFDSHKRIAHHQEAVSAATAALMTVLSVDATSSQIDDLQSDLEDRGQWTGSEANENLDAQINILNAQADLKISRASTQAADAEKNSRMLRMAGAIGLNMSLHYMADPENANLATAKAMDRPTLVHLRAYQSVWIDAYRHLIDFALARRGIVGAKYDIPAPRIARQDVSEAGKLTMEALDRGLLTDTQAAATTLDLLGFDDISKELEIRERKMDEEEEAEPTALEMELETEEAW